MNMQCSNCVKTTLVMADHLEVEIDYCPAYRGVWLERGELDKLLDKAVASSPVAPVQNTQNRKLRDDEHAEYRAPQPYYPSR
jgi:Zn-finger nucleic acid-binding protein